MRAYEIIDGETNLSAGILLYFEKDRTWIIELSEHLDEWTAPLLLTKYVKEGIYTIPRDISYLWVRERVIPSGRQNIQAILSRHRLEKYDEMKILELSGGKCSQDSFFIRKTDEIPLYVIERKKNNLRDCMVCESGSMLCFFFNGEIRKISLPSLYGVEGLEKIMKNRDVMMSGKISAGGYSVTFNDSIDIPAHLLFRKGTRIELELSDLFSFVRRNVYDTREACELLKCSRQNLAYLVGQGELEPVKKEVRGNLYLKGDVLKNTW